jgi:flagellar biosynthesis protein FliQ
MNVEQAIDILHSLVVTSLSIICPLLATAMTIGVGVSLMQSVTSIQEQTLSFVPKMVGVITMLVISAPWILRTLIQFTTSYLTRLPEMVR